MSTKARWLLVALSAPLVIVAAVGGLLGASPAVPQAGFEHLRVFEDVVSLVNGAYVEDVNPDRIFEGALRGLAEGLDPSSAFLTPEEVGVVDNKTPLGEGDPGLMITRQFYLRVLGVRDGSSAAKAGLQTGDFIRAIDDTPTRDMSAFAGRRLLHGAVGSSVKVLVIRGNAAEPHEVTLTRDRLEGGAAGSTNAGVGVVRLRSFGAGAADALKSQVTSLGRAANAPLVIDLRGIADGSYDEAIKAAELFIGSGPVAVRAGRDEKSKETITSKSGSAAFTMPVVILQSFGTTGPAEVFIAAMRGANRAELVGEHTAGLAAEQHLVRLPENYGLWMTYRRYYTLGTGDAATPILENGIAADVVVEEPNVEFGEAAPGDDAMLTKAIERAKARQNQ
jgi:carboxyl-terminal processing protease